MIMSRNPTSGDRVNVLALTGGIIHTGTETLHGHAVLIEDGRVAGVMTEADVPPSATPHDLAGDHLAPGFIDLQVNGGGGVLFNDTPTCETARQIANAHRSFGVTGLLLTYITGPADGMARAAEAVRQAMDEETRVPGVLGIHFEGPHLNPERTGVHDRTLIRPCNDADVAKLTHLCDLATGCTLVTLAPECVPLAAITTLAQHGAVIAAGHTMAEPDDLAVAIDAGLTGVTHLFNAMAPMGSRAPGTVGGALADDRLWCSIIADGHHVHPASMAAAWRAKPAGKLLLVSDAMGPVGSTAPTSFTLGDAAVQVGEGRCITPDGRLAGSLLSMDAAVRYCVNTLNIELDEALRMAATYPARAINQGDRRGEIAPGFVADLVQLDPALIPKATWIAGQISM